MQTLLVWHNTATPVLATLSCMLVAAAAAQHTLQHAMADCILAAVPGNFMAVGCALDGPGAGLCGVVNACIQGAALDA